MLAMKFWVGCCSLVPKLSLFPSPGLALFAELVAWPERLLPASLSAQLGTELHLLWAFSLDPLTQLQTVYTNSLKL